MKKRSLALILSVIMALTLMTAGFADDAKVPEGIDTAQEAADYLYELGLFKGTATNPDGSPVYELGRTPTRFEAVTMLVRLLGAADEAESGSWTTPFTDVYPWAAPYVGYAYKNGLTNGTSGTTYSGSDPINASQYLTFVLRALGYESGKDFQWQTSWQLTNALGITDGEYTTYGAFSRGDVAMVSVKALGVNLKGQDKTLYEAIFGDGAELPGTDDKPGSASPIATYSGSGSTVIRNIDLPRGAYYVEYTCSGDGNFSAWFNYGSHTYESVLVANDLAPGSGRRLISIALDRSVSDAMLDISAYGSWTIAIKPVTGETTTTNITGRGDMVTGVFTATTSRAVMNYSVTNGGSNFMVNLCELNGRYMDSQLAANEIAPASGSSLVYLTPGEQYFFAIESDGNWSIDLGLGDAVTNYPNNNYVPDTPDTDTPDTDTPGSDTPDDDKWSVSDVVDLSNYLSACSDDLQTAFNYASNAKFAYELTALAQLAAEGALANCNSALSMLNSHAELTWESGGTVTEDIETGRDYIQAALDMTFEDASNFSSDKLQFEKYMSDAMLQMLKGMNAAKQLLESFA